MPQNRNGDWFNETLADGGPVYMETGSGHLLVEPWNAISSLLILIPAIYWIYRMRKVGHKSNLMLGVIVLIIIGAIGSALFHAFRISVIFLVMDVLPSAILTLTLSIYFWIKVFNKWWYAVLVLVILFGARFLIWGRLPEHTSINVSYFLTGFTVGLPLIIYLFKTHFAGWYLVTGTVICFAIALIFRQIDMTPISFLPMGTHFLWHTFSATGAWFILDYLYLYTSSN